MNRTIERSSDWNINRRVEETPFYYLDAVENVQLLTAEEEKELAHRIQNGDEQAERKMIEANLRLVVHAARFYKNNFSMHLPDLLQAGNLGLIKAVRYFNPEAGTRFSSYAFKCIKSEMAEFLRQQMAVTNLSYEARNRYLNLLSIRNELMQKLGRQLITNKELAQESSLDIHTIEALQAVTQRRSHIENLDESSTPLEEGGSLGPEEYAIHQSCLDELEPAIDQLLSEREKQIIGLYFGLDNTHAHTLKEIGQILQLTAERIRQIKIQALEKLAKSDFFSYN